MNTNCKIYMNSEIRNVKNDICTMNCHFSFDGSEFKVNCDINTTSSKKVYTLCKCGL